MGANNKINIVLPEVSNNFSEPVLDFLNLFKVDIH